METVGVHFDGTIFPNCFKKSFRQENSKYFFLEQNRSPSKPYRYNRALDPLEIVTAECRQAVSLRERRREQWGKTNKLLYAIELATQVWNHL